MEALAFRHVEFTYPNTDKKALDDVSFAVRPSEFIVICGKSGCGKSTLLRHMKKNMMPYGDRQGEILYEGHDLAELDNRVSAAEIGFVQQNPENQIVTDKVWHELSFGLESLGVSNQEIRRRVAEMASFFGIQSWFRRDVYELSGGQKQLLNLASIMAMQPKVLVLDEPTSQLDPIAATEFLETLAKINRELGTTIILSEHRLEEVFPMADRVMVMEEGKVTAFDTIDVVGRFLSGQGERHPLFLGLPAPMKIYAEVKPEGPCPVTVREGRLWLNGLPPCGAREREPAPLPPRPPRNPKAPPLLELTDVWFRYEKAGADILRDLNMRVEKGEWFCLVGGNGVGKSTAMKVAAGLLKPYRGRIKLLGREMKKPGDREQADCRLGLLPQNPQALFTEITAEEELFDGLAGAKGSEKEKLERVNDMISLLRLEGERKLHPYDMSGGEQQRLALGKILLLEPQLLLLDEPTKGLDPFFKTILADILKKLQQQGVTICMVSHDIEFCAEYADTCAMFFDGGVVSQDAPRAFFGSNSFYTTASNRMSRHLFHGAITYRDVVDLCGRNLMPSN